MRDGFAAVDVAPSPKVQEYVNGALSGSEDPALVKFTVKGATPVFGLPSATATGGWFPIALIVMLAELVAFTPSETVSRAVYVPAVVYVRLGFAAVEVPPSPKTHEYDKVDPSGSDEPALEKATVSGALPEVGVPVATAIGG